MLKTNKGFVSVLSISFLMLLSLCIFAYGFIFYAQTQNDISRKLCFINIVNIQKHIARSEDRLFKLNPLSTALRIQLKSLKVALAAALVAHNLTLAGQIQLQIDLVLNKQISLDSLQKLIIHQGNLRLRLDLNFLDKTMTDSLAKKGELWKRQLSIKDHWHRNNPMIAIKPDSEGGIAPNYELSSNYKALQTLDVHLQSHFENRTETQSILKTTKTYSYRCQAYYERKGEQWDLKITRDKSL